MAKKEFHHFQFIDPNSGEVPFSVTLMIKYNYQDQTPTNQPALTADDLLDLDESLNQFTGDFKEQFIKVKDTKEK